MIAMTVAAAVTFLGCSGALSRVEPYNPAMDKEKEIGLYTVIEDTVWDGHIRITGDVYVAEGATLTIMPGTVIRFDTIEPLLEEDGGRNWKGLSSPYFPTAEIMVRGRLVASGTPDEPITFTSADKQPKPGSWGAISLLGSEPSIVEYCRIYYAYDGVHNHSSSAVVINNVFSNNGTAMAFNKETYDRPCRMFIEHNLIKDNLSGISARNSTVNIAFNDIRDNEFFGIWVKNGNDARIAYNNIVGNGKGVYLFRSEPTKISHNNIYGNLEYNMALAVETPNDVDATNNWWGTTDPAEITAAFFDKETDPELGKIIYEPFLNREMDANRQWSIGLP